MKLVFESCVPRDEVLKGDLREEMFAARLKDVVDGSADPIYGDPGKFFDNTFPTSGLKSLIREVMGRLTGKEPGNASFIRLETSFGGGKTHNLIALWHLAQGHTEGLPADVLPTGWRLSEPCQTAGVVGSDLDPANGIDHGDVTTHTLWGEIAYQIGGKKGYELVRKSDEGLVAPGTQVFEKLVGDKPALIMIDEIARHLRTAKAMPTANKQSDLALQTVAFLMSLIEFSSAKEKVSVVLTLAESHDAFGEDTDLLKQELTEAKRVSARQEHIITPTGGAEISKIVTHRLFASIDQKEAEKTSKVYHDFYSEALENDKIDLPQRAAGVEFADEIVKNYPFHPEFLKTLDQKTSTIPNFQRTRGALRLLAMVVRDLWEEKPKDAHLICIHHLDLGDDDIVNDLTSRLERPAFKSVIEADIKSPKGGSGAHCEAIDKRWVEAGKPPFARRAATAILLHSLTQGSASGVEPAELMFCLVQPDDDPALIKRSLSIMTAEEKAEAGTACWFLHFDGIRYRFSTEPSLEKIILDEVGMIGIVKAKGYLDDRIKTIWKRGTFETVAFPAEASELDDDAQKPKLAIIHYDAAASTSDSKTPPELVSKLFDHKGSMQDFRTYKNNVLFLVPDKDQVDRMVDVMQRYLAIERILHDEGRLSEFNKDQRDKLKGMKDSAELDVRVAITRAYRYLYYPSATAPKSMGGLDRALLPAQDQASIEKDQSAVVLKTLTDHEKVLTADDSPMPAAFVKSKAWVSGQESISTEDLRREFCKRIGLKIQLDINQIKKTVKNGVDQGTWVYFDANEQVGYGNQSPSPLVQISEDAILYTPEEAKAKGIKIKGVAIEPTICPICSHDPCICGEEVEGEGEGEGGGKEGKTLLSKSFDGAPGQVFQQISDSFADSKVQNVGRLAIRCEGSGSQAAADVRALGLAIPQMGKGDYHILLRVVAEFGQGPDAEKFHLDFKGSWNRYKRCKDLVDSFAKEATGLNINMTLQAKFDGGLDVESDQFGTMRDILKELGVGRIQVQAVALDDHSGKGE